MPEADGSSGELIDYDDTEAFKSLNKARRTVKLQACTFDVGLEPLTLAGEILSVVVIDADVYDRAFQTMVGQNTEGSVVSSNSTDVGAGIPFTEADVRRLLDSAPPGPGRRRMYRGLGAGAAPARLSWCRSAHRTYRARWPGTRGARQTPHASGPRPSRGW